jgi:hypothetical protein
MAKLVMRVDDSGSTTEFDVSKDRTTIGRRNDNDICLSNSAVSAEHAVVVSVLSDSYLEDLGSTNGTLVNGKAIKRHLLQNEDIVEIGRHRLVFEGDRRKYMRRAPEGEVRSASASVTESLGSMAQSEPANDPSVEQSAMLVVLNGSHTGQEHVINKDLISLGRPGLQIITITRRPHGYFLTHVEGQQVPKVNGRAVETQTYPLYTKDVIELGGVRLQFLSASPS